MGSVPSSAFAIPDLRTHTTDMGDQDPYAEHFDDGHSGKEHMVHQRIRANSSIMELKKILGKSPVHSFHADGQTWQ